MANQSWPSDLPDQPLKRGYEEGPPNVALRTQMDAGPDKIRRRTTAGPRQIAVQFRLSPSQLETLDTFYTDTLEGGTLRFDWTHPRTGTSVEFRFVEPPSYQALRADRYRVQAQLEIMP
jgi:hypothetical protein